MADSAEERGPIDVLESFVGASQPASRRDGGDTANPELVPGKGRHDRLANSTWTCRVDRWDRGSARRGRHRRSDGASRRGDVRELHPAGGTPIAGSYIVVFKDQKASQAQVHRSANSLAESHGGKVTFYYAAALRGYAAAMSATQAAQVAADPSVAYVEQDSVMRIDDTETNPPSWGLDRIDQRKLPLDGGYTYSTTASNVTVYIIDSGIRTTNVDFGGRASVGFDNVGDGLDGEDCIGHGTHVAGTVGGAQYGVAKGVKLVSVRVIGCTGQGPTSGVIAGVDWVTAHAVEPAVANVSLGGGFSAAMNSAVQNSIASGVIYAVAAGNADVDACTESPSSAPNAITVGATDITDARASFSNYGSCVDLFAPGVGITSDWYTSDTAVQTISGTSMAAPHVAGAAALYLAVHPKASPARVAKALVNSGTRKAVGSPGAGSPNELLFTGFIQP